MKRLLVIIAALLWGASLNAQNLILNHSCDEPLVGGNIPNWTEVAGTNWSQRCSSPNALPGNGTCYFFAGADATDELAQTISLNSYAQAIDSGTQQFYFHGYETSFAQSPADEANVYIEFLNAANAVLATIHLGPYTQTQVWQEIDTVLVPPPLTRNVKIRLRSIRHNGSNNDGYYDELYFGTLPPAAAFSASDSSICAGDCISYMDISANSPTEWLWEFEGGFPSTSSDQHPMVCYLDSGTYSVTLIARNAAGSDTVSFAPFAIVKSAPATPVITQSHDTLFCSSDPSYASYQWYRDTALVPGATLPFIVAESCANYNVSVIGTNGCRIAVGINVLLEGGCLTGTAGYTRHGNLSIYPSPTRKTLTISGLGFTVEHLDIYNALGMPVRKLYVADRTSEMEIDVADLPAGVYSIQLTGDNERLAGRFLKE